MYGWRLAMFGLGALVGAVGVALATKKQGGFKDGATTILSHGLALKRRAQAAVETTREGIDDLVAEADHKLTARQTVATGADTCKE